MNKFLYVASLILFVVSATLSIFNEWKGNIELATLHAVWMTFAYFLSEKYYKHIK